MIIDKIDFSAVAKSSELQRKSWFDSFSKISLDKQKIILEKNYPLVKNLNLEDTILLYSCTNNASSKSIIKNLILASDFSDLEDITRILNAFSGSDLTTFLDKVKLETILTYYGNREHSDLLFNYLIEKLRKDPDIINNIKLDNKKIHIFDFPKTKYYYEILSYLTPELRSNISFDWTKFDEFDDDTLERVLELFYNDIRNGTYVNNKKIDNRLLKIMTTVYGYSNEIISVIDNVRYLDDLIDKYNAGELDLSKIDIAYLKSTIIEKLKLNDVYRDNESTLNYYKSLTETEQIDIIKNCTNNTLETLLLLNNTTRRNVIQEISSRSNIINIESVLKSLNETEFEYYLSMCTDKILIEDLATGIENQKMYEEFMRRFAQNPLILAWNTNGNILFEHLTLENKNKMLLILKEECYEIFKESGLNFIFESNNPVVISSFIYTYKQYGKDSIDILEKLYSKNKNVIYTINYELLNSDIINLGYEFIEKISKYPEASKIVVKLYNSDPNSFKIFERLYKSFSDKDYLVPRDTKTSFLLSFFNNEKNKAIINKINVDELDDNDCKELMSYILKRAKIFAYEKYPSDKMRDFTHTIIETDFRNFKEYRTNLNLRCDELMARTTDLEDAKNILFNKFFDISLEDAINIFDMYGENFEKVKYYDEIGDATDFITVLKRILEIDDISTIKQIYYSPKMKFYSQEKLLSLEGTLKVTYAKSLLDELDKTRSLVKSRIAANQYQTIEFNGKKVKILEMQGNYNVLVNSTAAYGSMKLINNSFSDSWNLSTRTKNHGICCSYIGNNMLGMARVFNGGVMFGFFRFSNEALAFEAPYDINSGNDYYRFYAYKMPKYVSGDQLISNTRHTHNEIVIERKELRSGNYKYNNIQPDCLVLTSAMSEQVKENTYQASSEMDIPILYIDIDKNAKAEAAKIMANIKYFTKVKDLSILSSILDNYESNRCGMRAMPDYDFNDYISKDIIEKVFLDYIDYLKTLEDKEFIEEQFKQIREIILTEKTKFDIFDSNVRKNKIDIDYPLIFARMEE